MTISIEELHEILKYDPDTGKFTWRERAETYPLPLSGIRAFNTRNAGKEVYEEEHRGYGRLSLLGKRYKSHRVAWAMHTGDWPFDQIDHINGIRSDNRIENLRAVTQTENSRNMKRPSNNMSGVIGVYWDKFARCWTAQIAVSGKKIELCRTKDFEDAVAARAAAEVKYDFHPNHGRVPPPLV
jgi:hypothetical protein